MKVGELARDAPIKVIGTMTLPPFVPLAYETVADVAGHAHCKLQGERRAGAIQFRAGSITDYHDRSEVRTMCG